MPNTYRPIRELARRLGGGARVSGKFFPIMCPAHNDTRASASLWFDRAGRLRAKCFAGCEEQAVLAEISRITGLIAPDGTFLETAAPTQKLTPTVHDLEADIAEAKEAVKRMRLAEKVWSETHAVGEGTLGARFLRETRGLDLPRIPETIRCHTLLWHS
jgi:hypothetical protein